MVGNKYSKIINSQNNYEFGYLEGFSIKINTYTETMPTGYIYLYKGDKHFGLSHIWMRHKHSFTKENDIGTSIESILSPGAEIYYSSEDIKKKRVIIFKRKKGIVILEYRENPNIHYSIVTSYPATYIPNPGKKVGEYNYLLNR